MHNASFRAQLVARRTYCRPLDDGTFETWDQVVDRVVDHQRWLWERAADRKLSPAEEVELKSLRLLMHERIALPSGRILWMGGTEQAKQTEIAMFNCAFGVVRDVYSVVDAFYLLLNGCGVGFKPEAGLLNGFAKRCRIEVIDSYGQDRGDEHNFDYFHDNSYVLCVGDSGTAWAKALGKLLAMKTPVDRIVLDFSEIRRGGIRLKGYGWLSSGDDQIKKAFVTICEILNSRADQLLTEIDILDIINLAGTTLSSRRSAEIALLNADNPQADVFANAKKDHYLHAPWRSQSNNSLVFYSRPSALELRGFFARMLEAGGSEPGLVNGEAARKRAPWFVGCNPCGEILLPDGGLCNLVEVDLGKLDDKPWSFIETTIRLIARANYRQTCVNLKDGILSDRWHETNQFLRLCGVGLTGIVKWLAASSDNAGWFDLIKTTAIEGAHSMADELGLPRSKCVTTVKPSGTLGKLMDTTEGLHKPLGRYVFNWIKFDANDELIPKLAAANYKVLPDPYGPNNVIVCVPVDNGDMGWDKFETWRTTDEDTYLDIVDVNLEPAVAQLERYKLLMDNYVTHNASVTISYSPEEIPAISQWLYDNWDHYVGVSFILRTDPTKTAEDLGYPYLPQEVVSRETYSQYVAGLLHVDINGGDIIDAGECAGGACPVR